MEGIINSLAWSHADFFPVYLLHPSSAFILIIISFIVSHFPEVHVQRWIKDSFSSYMHDQTEEIELVGIFAMVIMEQQPTSHPYVKGPSCMQSSLSPSDLAFPSDLIFLSNSFRVPRKLKSLYKPVVLCSVFQSVTSRCLLITTRQCFFYREANCVKFLKP